MRGSGSRCSTGAVGAKLASTSTLLNTNSTATITAGIGNTGVALPTLSLSGAGRCAGTIGVTAAYPFDAAQFLEAKTIIVLISAAIQSDPAATTGRATAVFLFARRE